MPKNTVIYPSPPNTNPSLSLRNKDGKIFFFSETGTSRALSLRLSRLLSSHNLPFQLLDPSLYEPEDLPFESVIIAFASTWEDGRPPPNVLFLSRWLSDSASDFRVGSLLLSSCKFAVFGVGSRSYGSHFNAAAKDFSRQMRALEHWRSCPFAKPTLTEEILMRSYKFFLYFSFITVTVISSLNLDIPNIVIGDGLTNLLLR